jgi:tetratricopeptide (TPR) repeat protein
VSGWSCTRLEEIPVLDDGRAPWRPVRHHFGARAFGVNAFFGREAGDLVVNEHDEAGSGDEELYVVVAGHATFTVDGVEVDAPAGTLVFVEPSSTRTATAAEANTTVLVLGAQPGIAYIPGGWELWAPAGPLFEAGEYELAIELITPIAERHPEYPVPLYNLACCEALASRHDDALEHLRRAIEIDERFRSYAVNDTDLDALRDNPRFADLVGGL